jgi:hypothetical protein
MDAVLLVALLGTACSGGGETKSTAIASVPGATVAAVAPGDSRPAPTHGSTTTTTIAAAPLVIDRGRDVGEVARSLLRYGRFLEWHRPEAALVDRAYETGGPLARLIAKQVATLRRNRWHIVEVDSAPFELATVSRLPNVVTFRMTEHLAHREVLAADGRVVAHDGARTEHYAVTIMRFASDQPWRLALVDRRTADVEVQL